MLFGLIIHFVGLMDRRSSDQIKHTLQSTHVGTCRTDPLVAKQNTEWNVIPGVAGTSSSNFSTPDKYTLRLSNITTHLFNKLTGIQKQLQI